ncbi:MAG: glycosyltransferase [Microbacteriaceae bacterium]|nr:glycosyltransferase [Microbacteriaceae bacterium]
MHEPRRLAGRYLIQGPPALFRVVRSSGPARTARSPSDRSEVPSAYPGAPISHHGSIIIPAHNEATVIERMLRPLVALTESADIEIVVICNGCTDTTAELARSFPGVTVIEIERPSKSAALNAGDAAAHLWPRLYLDADVELAPDAVLAVLESLSVGRALAARPIARYDTAGAGFIVRSYYRARSRIPSLQSSLWGAGVYAVSEEGHSRFGQFPNVSGDDFWVDQMFEPAEKAMVQTTPVIVHTPKSVSALLGIMQRGHRGVIEVVTTERQASTSTARTIADLTSTARGIPSLVDATVYAVLSLAARRVSRQGRAAGWERDETSR